MNRHEKADCAGYLLLFTSPRFPLGLARQSAFTLWNCLLSVTLFIGIAALANTHYSALHQRFALRSIEQAVRQTMLTARYHALASQQPVTVCGSADGQQCDGQWQNGLLMRWRQCQTGYCQPSQHYLHWSAPGFDIAYTGFATANELQFTAEGLLLSNGQFSVRQRQAAKPSLRLIVSQTGRVRQG